MALSIPANSTILYLDNWRNGSLYPQIVNNFTYDVGNYSVAAVYSGNDEDQGLDLTILDDNMALLMFNASGFDNITGITNNTQDQEYNIIIAGTFALTQTLLDPTLGRVPVKCLYPISGQYDMLSRALFYVLMIFSLVFRRHMWISVAALGTAMTYAATSAVHLFALASWFGFKTNPPPYDTNSSQEYGDIDFLGILPNLTASAIMVTPILLYSTTVRKNDAQSIIVWWGILIFSALACLMYNMNGFNLNVLKSFAICSKDCVPDRVSLTLAIYQKCNCMDFCGTLGPAAPMRKGANMVAFLHDKLSDKIIVKDSFMVLWVMNLVALFFIALYGIMGLIISRFSPDEVRNAIFRFWNSDLRLWIKVIFEGKREARVLSYFHVETRDTRRTLWQKLKYVNAKWMATSFALTAGATAIICPMVFISSVVGNEIMIQAYPVSEYSDAVGAWGPWIGAMLVLMAAVINKYAGSWVRTFVIVLSSMWRFVKYSKEDRTTLHPKPDDATVTWRLQLFGQVLVSPIVHSYWALARGFWTFRTTIHFFAVWWRDTENVSQQRGKEIADAWEAEVTKERGGKPECQCYICKHDKDNLAEEDEHTIELARQRMQIRQDKQDDRDQAQGTLDNLLPSGAAPTRLSTTTKSSGTTGVEEAQLPDQALPSHATKD